VSIVTLATVGNEPLQVHLEHQRGSEGEDRISAFLDGKSLALSRFPAENGGVLRIGDRMARYYALRRERSVHIWIGGQTYEFAAPEGAAPTPGTADRAVLPPEGLIEAPMPGRVLKILVAPGQEVEGGAPLLIMESMKMELTVTAPAAAVVAEVRAEPGAMVQRGAALLRLQGAR